MGLTRRLTHCCILWMNSGVRHAVPILQLRFVIIMIITVNLSLKPTLPALDADSSTRLVAETKKAYIVVAVDMCVDLGDLVGRSALSRILEGLAGNVRR